MPLSAQLLRWPAPPLSVSLPKTEIHVWLIHLDSPSQEIDHLSKLLNTDELKRAERFATSSLKNRFIAGRGSLREIVSHYLRIPPADLPIHYGQHGKPELIGTALQFNLSHSEGLALCAVHVKQPIGIDLESDRSISDVEQLARQYFSTQEYTRLLCLPPEERSQNFLKSWTQREAYLKATGEGLAGLESLQQFPLDPIHPAPGWSGCPLLPLPGFLAALVVKGKGWQVRCWQKHTQPFRSRT